MSSSRKNIPPSIEDMILAAGDLVEVDRHLRPAIVEQAKAEIACRNAWRRGAILSTVVVCLAIAIGGVSTNLARNVAEQDMAKRERIESHLDSSDWTWGFVQMFRHVQSDRQRAFGKDK